jgi:alpha-beta hydrolase superfamily lysophospholipase
MTKTFSFTTRDNIKIITYMWEPKETVNIKGVIQIVHGSLEHAQRYNYFANELNKNGYIVYANDLRGHGKSAKTKDDLGHFSYKKNGWELAINDLHYITNRIREDYPHLPIYLFGHSMGSFLVRNYVSTYENKSDGFILSGTASSSILIHLIKLLAKLEIYKKGGTSRNIKLHNLVYGSLNRKIKNPKTSADFISRDMTEVKKYLQDPFCGYTATVEYIYEMLKGLIIANKNICFKSTPHHLKILLISGKKDPLGGYNGKGVLKVYNSYVNSGINNIKYKLYPKARHELINELNKKEVISDIINWLDFNVN